MTENSLDKRVMVRFISNCSPYLAGEKASFPPLAASRLVGKRVAVYAKDDDKQTEEVHEEEHDDDDRVESHAGDEQVDQSDAGSGKKSKKHKSGKKGAGKRKRVKADE